MERLWSPWRSKYIESFSERENGKEKVCVFCQKLAEHDDERNLIVYRSDLSAIIMNIYPYNSGHLLIVPFAHKGTFEELTDDENADVMRQTRLAIKLLRLASHPDGFNFGANLGRVSGAGIAEHVHFHVVPRWEGDSNFMPVLADTKVISEDLYGTLRKLTNALASVKTRQ
ncbi:MAG: HIT domain-containing protein [Bacteroidetes bacterium]|nr:HIT domain-containing protein [Bacteroidota bacterium]MCL5738758.1 HIT domain-containing protein [Bacteroidota bacterium]